MQHRRPPSPFMCVAAILCAGACAKKSDALPTVTGAAQLSQGLHSFADCGATLQYFQQEAIRSMTLQVEANAMSALAGYGGCIEDAAPAASTGSAAAPTAAVPNHSGTNNQVAGVDEADILKTFAVGDALYTAYARQPQSWSNAGGSVVISQVYPVAQAQVVGRLALTGQPLSLFVNPPYMVIFSSEQVDAFGTGGYGYGVAPGVAVGADEPAYYYGGNAVRMSVVDMNDVTNPTIIRSHWLQGSYVSARMINQSIRVVSTSAPIGPALSYWPASLDMCNPALMPEASIIQAMFSQLIASNTAVIKSTQLTDWLPQVNDHTRTDASDHIAPVDCADIMRPGTPSGTDTTSITTFSLASDADIQGPWDNDSVIAEGDTVYASPTALYVATNPYDASYWSQLQQAWANNPGFGSMQLPLERTNVHRFDISDPTHTVYSSSNEVDGSLINKFAMDEQGNTLRVASTTRRYAFIEQGLQSDNDVFTLQTDAPNLPLLGQLRGLEFGEHMTAVRFVGPQLFMSTMLQQDPFLVVDLSNPKAPTLVGSLPVPGDATYLQSLDPNHLLAIGYGNSPQGYGWMSGVQLSVYDVTQASAPQLSQNTTLAGDYVYSAALYDSLALTYFTTTVGSNPVNLLAFPVQVFSSYTTCQTYNCYEDGLRVYQVDTAHGFTYLGDVYHNSLSSSQAWGWETVQRSMIMGPTADGKTYVVSASDLGEKITDLSAFTGQSGEVPSVQQVAY